MASTSVASFSARAFASPSAFSFAVVQLVCAMSFESDSDLELYPHLELELRTESYGSSRETIAQWSVVAPCALADDPGRPLLERLWAV